MRLEQREENWRSFVCACTIHMGLDGLSQRRRSGNWRKALQNDRNLKALMSSMGEVLMKQDWLIAVKQLCV
jgi:hypothetical protein